MDTLLEQATPRPWAAVESAHDFEPGPGWYVTGNGGEDYAAYCGSTQFDANAGRADAELIVRAVNAYEPLVKALQGIKERVMGTPFNLRNDLLAIVLPALATLPESDSGYSVESSPEREGGE